MASVLDYASPQPRTKSRVSYHHKPSVGNYHFGQIHPMKPHRLALTNSLVLSYGLHEKMTVYSPRAATKAELAMFHTPEYVDFLSKVTPENATTIDESTRRIHNIASDNGNNGDCPTFAGIYEFCSTYTGSSLSAARTLLNGSSDIAINWSGGLHHAQKNEASGFCYVNDIVIAILYLLRLHARVLYIDIDIHHGDGVQNAFWTTDRVMTLSFHKFSPANREYFFPGTGSLSETGERKGSHYSLNFPLQDGITDDSYLEIFKNVTNAVVKSYRPSSIVLQCGADSLGSDRLGRFSLSIQGHAAAVKHIKSMQLPLLILGGGGYTLKNVARCWTAETAVICDEQVSSELPETPYHAFFGPDFSLYPLLKPRFEDQNTKKYLNDVQSKIMEELRYLDHAPNVMMDWTPDMFDDERDEAREDEVEEALKDRRTGAVESAMQGEVRRRGLV
ncbi:Histone deacetylase [Taphrina deformans PYCC 5710]|uniref:Histone deacetylase n=1 Tax=Taphrina deformans (strain PYCC 5710 / ATCC 11124 / CBS 356.35 / IMI 108563 / JCM 9778 / NBRC 8474) TaxID=1097556 RepID=R4XAS8_TAPDE|nr:Histone deacetylase [Taphrina deformans PYCC 5710]|eukprot:CCG82923.1 Histone deacetylase [Taphrina deformans PYCC 5710]